MAQSKQSLASSGFAYTFNCMKRGRPPIPKTERLSIVVCNRLTKAEYEKIRAAAKRAGLSVSKYVRAKLVGGR